MPNLEPDGHSKSHHPSHHAGVVDVAPPSLDRLAAESAELVRLAIVDGEELVFVARAHGATRGLRYDPDRGLSVRLSHSSAGHAWLSTLDDEEALRLVARRGFGPPSAYGSKAPTTVKALLAFVHAARKRGYATINEVFAPAMSAMAAPVVVRGVAIGVMTIAGPAGRLDERRMNPLGGALIETGRASLPSCASTVNARRSERQSQRLHAPAGSARHAVRGSAAASPAAKQQCHAERDQQDRADEMKHAGRDEAEILRDAERSDDDECDGEDSHDRLRVEVERPLLKR